ncbi:MAG: Cys-Gln thioester bond-forming surface protein, partial [Acetivibrio ethanolgignens]
MKKRKKWCKIIAALLAVALFFTPSSVIFAMSNGATQRYEGYTALNGGSDGVHNYYIKDGANGGSNVAYCYDVNKESPSWENKIYRSSYTRVENYLEKSDAYIDAYGKDKKQQIAVALYAGYPHDGYGLSGKYGVYGDQARAVTQMMIWGITNNMPEIVAGKFKTENQIKYCQELYKYVQEYKEDVNKKFEQGQIALSDDLAFKKQGEGWQTNTVSVIGQKGSLKLVKYPAGTKVYDGDTDKEITEASLGIGQKFYLKTETEPAGKAEIIISYSYEQVKFYFYISSNERIQNLIRIEPTGHKEELFYQVEGDTLKKTEEPTQETIDIRVEKVWEDDGK